MAELRPPGPRGDGRDSSAAGARPRDLPEPAEGTGCVCLRAGRARGAGRERPHARAVPAGCGWAVGYGGRPGEAVRIPGPGQGNARLAARSRPAPERGHRPGNEGRVGMALEVNTKCVSNTKMWCFFSLLIVKFWCVSQCLPQALKWNVCGLETLYQG